MENTLICPQCGKKFTYTAKSGAKRKYCSLSCQRRATANSKNKRRKDLLSEYNHKGYLSKYIINLYNRKCAICGWQAIDKVITTHKGRQYACGNEIHHIIPVREGGKSNYSNLILLCPNHHKQAELGIIDRDTLKSYLKEPPTEEEKQAMKDRSVERIAAAIFGGLKQA